MKYNYKESYNLGNGEIIVSEESFESRKDARNYLNSRVKEVKGNDKNWATYYSDNSDYFFEKELRLKKEIKLEDEGSFDIGESNIYYSFEVEMIG